MRFDHLRLRNFKPYGDVSLNLSPGVTVIHGLNGSGKSSLLEACFFALYGSRALDATLADVITEGESESEIELRFTHDGGSYRISRSLARYDDRIDHDCTLEGPDVTLDGATDVRAFVTDLLRMDPEAFVNCAYVRQGEVNKLINATPARRREMIDDLLQLGRLEAYRERAGEARLGVEDVLGNERGALAELDRQIEAKEDRDLADRLAELKGRLAELDERVDHYETQREAAVETRDEAERVLDEYEARREELETVTEEIEALEAEIREVESRREELAGEIADAREAADDCRGAIEGRLSDTGLEEASVAAIEARRAELEDRAETLRDRLSERRTDTNTHENESESLAEKAEELAERAEAAAERADELESAADEAEADAERRADSLVELDAEADDLRGRFAAADDDVDHGGAAAERDRLREERSTVRERIAQLEADLGNVRERVAEAEELLSAGKCPECGQDVADSPHADRLETDRERVAELESELAAARERRDDLTERLEAVEPLVEAEERLDEIAEARPMLEERVAEKRAEAEELRDRAAEKRAEAEELRDRSAEARDAAAEARDAAAEAADRVAELEVELAGVDETREAVDAVAERLDRVADLEDRIERLREKRRSLADQNDLRRDRLAEKRDRRDELREAVDEDRVREARENRAEAVEYIEEVDAELERLSETRDELVGGIESAKTELQRLEELRTERAEQAERVDALESLHEETERVEEMYGDLRAELRRRNVETLERTLNETFDLVYGNDAYSHIELDGEYELTVYQKDGQSLAPEQLSGGERALFNLSLRCAVYRLLAEGIEGSAPTPPLILDEPTVFLDAGHVSRLADLVEEMRGFGVSQIIIVSHDEELIGTADELVVVEKDPTTNRSTVRREAAPAAVDALADD